MIRPRDVADLLDTTEQTVRCLCQAEEHSIGWAYKKPGGKRYRYVFRPEIIKAVKKHKEAGNNEEYQNNSGRAL